ncbi:MAG: DUF87 domain-containing protein [bacterium]
MTDYEKLGVFYLGKKFDVEKNVLQDDLILYDSKDLTTHAVCMGMTGSGKTGLCISLLEEAAIDGIPAIIIDPKGDMANLFLTFPDLKPENFLPWIDESEASRQGITVDEFAKSQSELWKNGLEKWHQSGDRIKRLKEAAEFRIFTPGSTSGIPVSILKSFETPDAKILEDTDLFHESINTTVASLLGLLGIDADPIKSREHILLSNIINNSWSSGENLDLSKLISSIQNPPFTKVGVIDLDQFYPQRERMELAMSMNNLLAAPTFQNWLQGEALDINSILYDKKGKPRISIFYIAHLSDAERMFFVSLLLNQYLGWVRTQSGTTSLRSLLYFDEIFGYMPPTAEPASKRPMLTLLKQARAFGCGIVLATQNPVDLDYKGLANAGTWFIGRMQTERDKERVLDGLSTAISSSEGKIDRKKMEELISSLGKRIFLMHNVHENEPVVFQSRWAMSYLAGPLTREQIKRINISSVGSSGVEVKTQTQSSISIGATRPALPQEVKEYFIPVRSMQPDNSGLVYKPYFYGSSSILYSDAKLGIDQTEEMKYLIPSEDSAIVIDWSESKEFELAENELSNQPEESASFESLPHAARQAKSFVKWNNDFKDFIFRSRKINLLKSPLLKQVSAPGELERDFKIRLSQLGRESRDEWVEKIRSKYSTKIASLESKIRTAEERQIREAEQSKQHNLSTALSVGATILGAFLGRKAISSSTISKAGTAVKNAGKIMKEKADAQRAKESVELLKQQLTDLQNEFQNEVAVYSAKYDVMNEQFETVVIYPKKNNIQVKLFCLAWAPFWKEENGNVKEAFI